MRKRIVSTLVVLLAGGGIFWGTADTDMRQLKRLEFYRQVQLDIDQGK